MPSIDFFGERYTEPSDVVLVATRAVASEVNFNYDLSMPSSYLSASSPPTTRTARFTCS